MTGFTNQSDYHLQLTRCRRQTAKKEMYLIVLKPERRLGEPSTENTLWLLKMNILLIVLTLAKIAHSFLVLVCYKSTYPWYAPPPSPGEDFVMKILPQR